MQRLSSEIRKEQIKEAVLQIIYKDGISKFTTKRLAEKIGISEATIFKHFLSKKEIFFNILQDVDLQLIATMKEIENLKEPAGIRLHKIVCSTIHYIVKNKGVSVLMLSEIDEYNHPELRDKVLSIFQASERLLNGLPSKGSKRGELNRETDPQAFSLLYMGIPIGVHIELLLNKTDFFEEGFCERMSKTFLLNYIKPADKMNHNLSQLK